VYLELCFEDHSLSVAAMRGNSYKLVLQPCRILECTAKLLVQHLENCVLNTATDWHHWLDWRILPRCATGFWCNGTFRLFAKLTTYVTDTCLTDVQSHCPFIGETFIIEGFLEVKFPYWPAFVSFLERLNETQDLYSCFLFRHKTWRSISYPIRYSLPKEVLWPW